MLTPIQLSVAIDAVLGHLAVDWFSLSHLPHLLQEDVQPYADRATLTADVLLVTEALLRHHSVVVGSLESTGIRPWSPPDPDAVLSRVAASLDLRPVQQGGFGDFGSTLTYFAFSSRLHAWKPEPHAE